MVTIRKISTAKNRLKTGKGSDGRNFILYYSDEIDPKALLVYIHGGGLLYGTPEDLPKMHVEKFTSSGYAILAIDYPLAPQTKIDAILEDIVDSINKSFKAADLADSLPLFVWGRSAGAYLALLSSVNDKLTVKLNGIISYYGYGFLNDGWYDAPSAFYVSSRLFPQRWLRLIGRKLYIAAHSTSTTALTYMPGRPEDGRT